MFPTHDSEFLILYLVYLLTFLILLTGTLVSKNRKAFKNNLVFFCCYTAIMVAIFVNEDNFKYGNSLAVLFYGAAFILLHVVIFLIRRMYLLFAKRSSA